MTVPVSRARVHAVGPNVDAAGPLRGIRDLPGPKGLPLLGNLLQIDQRALHLVLERWAAEHGSLYRFKLGTKPVVAVSDTRLAEQVLRDRPAGFSRSAKLARVIADFGTDGVFSAEGEDWRRQRKLAVHALAQRNLRAQYQHLTTIAGRLAKRWSRLADAGEVVDITEELKRFTVDSTTLIAFGYDVNSIERDGDAVQRKLELIFPALHRRLFALLPVWRIVRLPQDRRLDRALADLRVWLEELVADTQAHLADDPARGETPSNFLEAMLAARDEDGESFSNDALFANLTTMLLAGEDTTANTLAWAVHHLCENPDDVVRLRQEADGVLGAAALPSDVDVANRLVCAGAVADETMRLRPVAPVLFIDANVDTVVGDLRVPKGTQLVIVTRPGAVDPAHFDDPQAFRPQRWLDGRLDRGEAPASIPFGSGPRICPGRFLALLEMRLVLSMLYRNFDVERVGEATEVRELFSFTMTPVGLKVRLRRRN